MQAFRRPSKEKSQSGGGCHFQSPRTEGGVREGSAGRRSTIAAIGGVAIPTHRGRSHVSHRVATQNRRFDTRTRFSEGGPESASRRVDGRWSANCGVNSSNPHVFCARHRRMVEQQEFCWGLWWHRGQHNWQVVCKECSLSATVKLDPL